MNVKSCVYDRDTKKWSSINGFYIMKCVNCGFYVRCYETNDKQSKYKIIPTSRHCIEEKINIETPDGVIAISLKEYNKKYRKVYGDLKNEKE